jgi:hypothetical protein
MVAFRLYRVLRVVAAGLLIAATAGLGWWAGGQLAGRGWRPLRGEAQPERKPPVAELPLAEQVALVRSGRSATIQVALQPLADADLVEWSSLANLQVLLLDHAGNAISDAGCQALARAEGLVHLRIRGGDIGDAGLAHLARLPRLKVLNLPQCRCTDRGIASLAALPRLESLRLGSPYATDVGMESLEKFPALRQLHFIDLALTDAALPHLAALPRLESLYLDGGRFTEEGLARLQASRPDLHLHINQQHLDRDLRGGRQTPAP